MLTMEVNLDNISYNIQTLKEKTEKEIIAVIKSDAYGYGVIPIAKHLVSIGIRMFAVNDLTEAIELCENYINQDILVLNSIEYHDYAHLYKYSNLIISINSLEDAINLNQYYYGIKTKVHIHIDTGMNRLGINNLQDYLDVLDILSNNEKFNLQGIYTHFISSNQELCEKQIASFSSLVKMYDFKVIHCLNTGAIGQNAVGNYARIGLGLYGFLEGLKPTLKVMVKPLWVKKILKGESIGYEQKYLATTDINVALLPVGYGNGYSRAFENFYVIANDKKFKIIGHICMNHMFIEVDESVNKDTIFYLLNDELTVKDLADYIHTTPHQISCMLKIRNKKYINER